MPSFEDRFDPNRFNGCGARIGKPCVRCQGGWVDSVLMENIQRAVINGTLHPDRLPCGGLIEEGKRIMEYRSGKSGVSSEGGASAMSPGEALPEPTPLSIEGAIYTRTTPSTEGGLKEGDTLIPLNEQRASRLDAILRDPLSTVTAIQDELDALRPAVESLRGADQTKLLLSLHGAIVNQRLSAGNPDIDGERMQAIKNWWSETLPPATRESIRHLWSVLHPDDNPVDYFGESRSFTREAILERIKRQDEKIALANHAFP